MNDKRINPFDAASEPDRHAIWEMLVTRDNRAFASADWSLVANDFAADRFEGISANGSADPADWSLEYPTLDGYRDRWLHMAEEYRCKPVVGDRLTLLFELTTLDRIEIHTDRAVAWKQFKIDAPLQNGKRWQVSAQTLYRLHRIGGQWRIAGFVGYLPLEVHA
ncbi:MAG: hypothetical protein JXA69_01945 [Phycisphaerae bacterium]|nr:hypothetical protein [Phycisphaerae bacterium]